MAENRETEPLLDPENRRGSLPNSTADSPSLQQPQSNSRHALRVIVLIATISLISDLAGYAAVAPQLDIFEGIICRQYYTMLGDSTASDQLDREKCKIEPVQSELALINGWTDTFQTIPGRSFWIVDSGAPCIIHESHMFLTGILLALPYGALADRIGRKPVLLLGMAGCLLGETWVRFVCETKRPITTISTCGILH